MIPSDKLISPRALAITPSTTLAVDAKAKALKASGEDVCGFGAGEPDFDTPQFIKDACAKALAEGQTKYCPAAGLPQLRKALAQKYKDFNKVSVTDAQVVVSAGGKLSCYLGIAAVISEGDEVLIPAPYWVSYPEMVKLVGGTPVILQTTDQTDFKLTPEQLQNAITPRTKMLILNSPSNPTGAVYSRQELEKIVEIALSHNLLILSDEIYEHLLYDGQEHFSPASFSPEAAESVITVSGFSKSYSMTGWRLGTLVASPKITPYVIRLQEQMTSNANTFAQFGALAAIERVDEAKKALAPMLAAFDRRRLRLLAGLQGVPKVACCRAQGAFYLFPNISAFGMGSLDFANLLLEKEKVAVVPGSAFGADDYIRFSYAAPDETIEKGIERFTRFCSQF
jgi:aspartate aminotransferase